jgi:hypothetical protein
LDRDIFSKNLLSKGAPLLKANHIQGKRLKTSENIYGMERVK